MGDECQRWLDSEPEVREDLETFRVTAALGVTTGDTAMRAAAAAGMPVLQWVERAITAQARAESQAAG
jgi:hypothetical protein